MQTINLRYQLHLHWRKIILLFLLCIVYIPSFSQARYNAIHTSGQDNKRLSYGFFLAGHSSTLRIKYSDEFMDITSNKVRNVAPIISQGFALGFLGVLKLHDQVNFNFTPKVGFYAYQTEIIEALPNPISYFVATEASMIEFPLFFKYKSQRFNNNRMFVTAGATPMFRTQSQDDANQDGLVILGKDITVDVSMGFDFYFKYFKFSPEVKFSHGLNNIYSQDFTDPRFNQVISDVRRRTISIILNFQ